MQYMYMGVSSILGSIVCVVHYYIRQYTTCTTTHGNAIVGMLQLLLLLTSTYVKS